MTEVAQHIDQLPPPPRKVTRRGWWRAWGDRRVRFWLICVAAITGIMAYIISDRIGAALRERKLIREGVPVVATIIELEGSRRPGYSLSRSDSRDVELQAKLQDGRELHMQGSIPAGGAGYLRIGNSIEIRVDPNDPSRWTERKEMVGWGTELVIPLSLVPLVLVLLGIAIWQRQRVLSVWRNGQPVEGIVLELKHTAIAPFSRLVRFSIPEDRHKRIYATLIPNKDGVPEVGEVIWLLTLPDKIERCVLMKLYS